MSYDERLPRHVVLQVAERVSEHVVQFRCRDCGWIHAIRHGGLSVPASVVHTCFQPPAATEEPAPP